MKDALKQLSEIRKKIDAAGGAVVMLDFDGTLAPLVDDPRQAFMDEKSRRALSKLVKHRATAIITGRMLSDVVRRVPIPGLSFAGNHGFEWQLDGIEHDVTAPPDAHQNLQSMRGRMQLLTQQFSGAIIEDKGHTLSLHFRHASPKLHAAIKRATRRAAEEVGGIRVVEGILVDNILPAESRNKGNAAKMMYEHLAGKKKPVPIFIGDDASDEDAFKALKRGIGVHVGKPVKSAAGYFLRSQKEVAAFLEGIIE